jgi:hypothetical protein
MNGTSTLSPKHQVCIVFQRAAVVVARMCCPQPLSAFACAIFALRQLGHALKLCEHDFVRLVIGARRLCHANMICFHSSGVLIGRQCSRLIWHNGSDRVVQFLISVRDTGVMHDIVQAEITMLDLVF